jgi:hypothetical protein
MLDDLNLIFNKNNLWQGPQPLGQSLSLEIWMLLLHIWLVHPAWGLSLGWGWVSVHSPFPKGPWQSPCFSIWAEVGWRRQIPRVYLAAGLKPGGVWLHNWTQISIISMWALKDEQGLPWCFVSPRGWGLDLEASNLPVPQAFPCP